MFIYRQLDKKKGEKRMEMEINYQRKQTVYHWFCSVVISLPSFPKFYLILRLIDIKKRNHTDNDQKMKSIQPTTIRVEA